MLYHFSEESSIQRFVPRLSSVYPDLPPLVWAIDDVHAPLYYLPRDCPRVAFWQRVDTAEEDIHRFFGYSTARMVISVEGAWVEKIHKTTLYAYAFASDTFRCFDTEAGYYVSEDTLIPAAVNRIDGLMEHLARAGVELRITPSLYPLHDAVTKSSLQFSIIRMRNATH